MPAGCAAWRLLTRSHSVRKLKAVYHDNRREYVVQLGLELYRSTVPATQAAAAASADGLPEEPTEEDDAAADADGLPLPADEAAAAPPPPQQHNQLLLLPTPVLLPPARRATPMDELLARFSPKPKRVGACPLARAPPGARWLLRLLAQQASRAQAPAQAACLATRPWRATPSSRRTRWRASPPRAA